MNAEEDRNKISTSASVFAFLLFLFHEKKNVEALTATV